jgi:hypothetical protein
MKMKTYVGCDGAAEALVGSQDGASVGLALDCALGCALGLVLGCVLSKVCALGCVPGCALALVLGDALGLEVGGRLETELGKIVSFGVGSRWHWGVLRVMLVTAIFSKHSRGVSRLHTPS